jgi:hypothetical protein
MGSCIITIAVSARNLMNYIFHLEVGGVVPRQELAFAWNHGNFRLQFRSALI